MKFVLKFFLVLIFVAALCAHHVPAQTPAAQQMSTLRIEPVRGRIGTKINIPVRLLPAEPQALQTLEGRIVLSNSSLLFPEEWQFPQGAQNLASRVVRLNDSVYSFAIGTRRASIGDTLAYLRCEVLAGSDSLVNIHFRDARLTDSRGSRTIAGTSGTVAVSWFDVDVPFVRFAQLQQNAPNPVQRGTSTRWIYTIDMPSDVVFTIYTLLGDAVERIERKQERGTHIEEWTPRVPLAAGAYFVRFSTNSGDIVQRLIIE